MLTLISLTRGLAGCTEYDANNVCIQADDTLTPTPTTGLEVIAETIAAGKAGATVPLKKCPWYATPTIGETDLICKFPSTSVLILGGAAILGLAFFSMRT